jgi:hypothetical protein
MQQAVTPPQAGTMPQAFAAAMVLLTEPRPFAERAFY